MWGVKCGDYITEGTDRDQKPPRHPHLKAVGKLEACAILLERLWKRRVIVPKELRGKIVKRTFRGTPEQIAEALGVKLGPKLKRISARRIAKGAK